MLTFLYKFIFPVKEYDTKLKKNVYKIKRKWNALVDKITNIIMPIYYKFFKSSYGLNEDERKEKIVITVTTIPNRTKQLKLCLETLLRQTLKPDKIQLWLDEDRFNKDEMEKLLSDEIRKGVELKFCKDVKVHTKYYYSMQENRDDIVITVDDDCYYPENLIENLMKEYEKGKNDVICCRAHQICVDEKRKVKKYSDWVWCSPGIKEGRMLLATGVGGVLYPPNIFGSEVFNKDVFLKLCVSQDDMWLKTMELIYNINVRKVNTYTKEWFTIKGTQSIRLSSDNVDNCRNDESFDKLIQYYNIKL